jgi:G3E family GTPase
METAVAKVSLLTGFLGSGKTTLLNALLRRPDMGRTAVLVNEFGEIGIDHDLIETVDEKSVLLSSGCICCSIQNDLSKALHDLWSRELRGEVQPIEHVLIETSGLADPAPVVHTLISDESLAKRYPLDAVVTTVDAVNGALQLDRYPESVKQAALADRLLVTKCDIADPTAVEALEDALRDLNPGAPILRTLNGGGIDPAALFDAGLYDPATKRIDVQRWLRDEAILSHERMAHDHRHHDHGHHDHDRIPASDHGAVVRHDARIGAFCLTRDEPLDWRAFVAWVQGLITRHGDSLLRVKGIANIAGEKGPLVVHGVQHVFHQPVFLPAWPSRDRRSRIVVIARNLDRSVVAEPFEALPAGRRRVSATAAKTRRERTATNPE